MREKTESKITVKGKSLKNTVKASYHMGTHDISLFGFQSSTAGNIWHEIMHKALWEDKDIPEEATKAWDIIAEDIKKHLDFPDEPFFMNYGTMVKMLKGKK